MEPARIPEEPPVVARLVIELRSDGTQTITRGALEDHLSGETVAIEARASSPIELATNLAKMLLEVPALAAQGLGGTLPSAADLRAAARAEVRRLGRRLKDRVKERLTGRRGRRLPEDGTDRDEHDDRDAG